MSSIFGSCSVWVFLAALTAGAAPASAQSIDSHELSFDIQVMPEIRPTVARMLSSSATFRAQYQRIADADGIVVGVLLDPTLHVERLKSQTTFRRYGSGLMVAIVTVAPGPRSEEWIAHEFEHILEQLDGWDLPSLAQGHTGRVWSSGDGMFETIRAVSAGRAVFGEIHHEPLLTSSGLAQE